MKNLQKMVLWISLISIVNNTSYSQDSIYLEKDKPAPFTGFLLPEETVKELKNNTLERDSYKRQLDLTNQNVDILNKEKIILLDQNLKLIQSGTLDHTLNNWEKAGYFFGGIILTGLAIKGAQNLRP